ncbi:DoxX family protein [Actinomarinicola tropica]|uniref:DoxX family protein n=1 Tax=Actinomarinicola tropica TaxID=2789776 RepID=A0A5Q2RI86_9ACTN|nr:DoxX family protein [Actinomarinicola tropica]QGG94281.1 DoxX family protein [Actinomarinicola tropica]
MTLNALLWIIAGFFGVAFTFAGTTLVLLPKERYRRIHESQHWVDDFTPGQVKGIGVIKVLGGLGLLLPAVGDVAPGLVPVAACGLALFMAGAGATRLRRGEVVSLVGDVVFLGLFVLLAWGRFDLEPFV